MLDRAGLLVLMLLLGACGGGGGGSAAIPPADPAPTASASVAFRTLNADSPFVSVSGTSQSISGVIELTLADRLHEITPSSGGSWQWQPTQCSDALAEGDYRVTLTASAVDGTEVQASRDFSVAAQVFMKVHYYRRQANYEGWGLHLWGNAVPVSAQTSWASPRSFDCQQDGWVQYWVPLQNLDEVFNLIVHAGDVKNTPDDLSLVPRTFGTDVFIVQGDPTLYASQVEAQLAATNAGNASANLDLSPVAQGDTGSALPAGWADSSAFMEIYVRGYQDSDGDGQGDLPGLIQRLPYLADLGVKGLWLMPITESSDNDHGYAVVDYRDIEDDYGDLSDFQTLLSEAHRLGMGVIIDYVMNHSSSANPLFLDASFSADNPKRAWYNFASTDLGWGPWGNGWRQSGNGDYYYAPFSAMMPDFNLRNPEVVQYHLDNLRFWLNMGVDGFRFDAVGVLYESADGNVTINHPDNHPLLAQVQQLVASYDNRFMVCEAPDGPLDYAQTTSCGRAFAFGVQQAILQSVLDGGLRSELFNHFNQSARDRLPLILSNHDHFAGDRPMSYLLAQDGIDTGNVDAYLKAAASVYLLSSATPFTYYGEEVGQTGAGGDWALRRPMSWTDDITNAGFSSATPFRPPVDNVVTNNVQALQLDSESLLLHYAALYEIRQQYPVLASGELTLHSSVNDPVLAFTRESSSAAAVVLVNLSDSQQSWTVPRSDGMSYREALQKEDISVVADGDTQLRVSLPAHSTAVLIRQ